MARASSAGEISSRSLTPASTSNRNWASSTSDSDEELDDEDEDDDGKKLLSSLSLSSSIGAICDGFSRHVAWLYPGALVM